MADERHDYETVVEWKAGRRGVLGAPKVERVLKMAEKHCFISNSLKGEVRVEPEIIVA